MPDSHIQQFFINDETPPRSTFLQSALFTYQKPVYKNYNASVTFSDGQSMGVNANNMIVKEIPQVLIELDPKYDITKNLNAWLSFRYFGKTYANLQEALYFNGHWETFGGVNWQASKRLSLGCTVVNFLNQTGAKIGKCMPSYAKESPQIEVWY